MKKNLVLQVDPYQQNSITEVKHFNQSICKLINKWVGKFFLLVFHLVITKRYRLNFTHPPPMLNWRDDRSQERSLVDYKMEWIYFWSFILILLRLYFIFSRYFLQFSGKNRSISLIENVLALLQQVYKPVELWDITFYTPRFWSF